MYRVLTLILLSILILTLSARKPTIQPDPGQCFRVYQSFITESGGYRDTTLRVILCSEKMNDLDGIFEEIKNFHQHMNGASDKLTIYLYRSKMDLQQGKEITLKIYFKED